MTIWRRIRQVWVTLGIAFTVVFVGWSLLAYRATTEARMATQSDSAIRVQHDDGVWTFAPVHDSLSSRVAYVFFPGALVDPLAYAPLLRAVAAAGYRAYLVELPRRGAFGGADEPAVTARLERVIAQLGPDPHWVASGHSRGGVVASRIASEHHAGFSGLVLIGTSHPRDVDLSALAVPVTKIAGTRDGLASRAEVEANRPKMPSSAHLVWIEGGNHSQFGWYGFQPGDHRATVTASEQHRILIGTVVDALRAVGAASSSSALPAN